MRNQTEQYKRNEYSKLMWMALVSFVSMYLLLYAMLDGFKDTEASEHPLILSAIMTFPSIILEVLLLGGIQKDMKFNVILILLSVLAFLAFYRLLSGEPDLVSKEIQDR